MFNNLMSKFIDNHAPLIYLFEIRILKITKIWILIYFFKDDKYDFLIWVILSFTYNIYLNKFNYLISRLHFLINNMNWIIFVYNQEEYVVN
jgi:hypothetical protein